MVIDVADRGPGIPAESRRQVLEPFFALPGSRYANPLSSGIGLTIAARAVQRWGGAIDVLPTDPQGATFRVVLPST
jgi:signal transduction histidine kinase